MGYALLWGALVVFLILFFVRRRGSTLSSITGPPSPSWTLGHVLKLMIAQTYGEYEFKCLKTYGPVHRLKGCFGQNRLMVADLLASQFTMNSPHFELSPSVQNMILILKLLERVGGVGGVGGVTGKEHKRLRNEFNTVFAAGTTRSYIPILKKAAEGIADKLELATDTVSINIMPVISTAALMAMAEAALGYSVDDFEDGYVSANVQIIQSPGQILGDALGTKPSGVGSTCRSQASHTREKQDLAQRGLDISGDIFVDPDRSDTTRTPLTAEPFTERMALQDTVVLLSESITTATGAQISQITLSKGDVVIVGTTSYQRLESGWGKDANEFRPSRWIEGEVSKGEVVGPYANLSEGLTRLGWRFAILEMQVVICELVGKFAFTIPENDPISVRLVNTLHPTMKSGRKGVPFSLKSIRKA
ncbi:cytochrome P450 [Mycena olivaceomarginata]|nr:cytochrome P450 [Mycena olivaceomarginata]